MTTNLVRKAGAAACAAVLAATLAACGGGGSSAPTPVADNDLPPAALADAEAFQDWMAKEATARADDSAEPLVLGKALPPASDTTEPVPLK